MFNSKQQRVLTNINVIKKYLDFIKKYDPEIIKSLKDNDEKYLSVSMAFFTLTNKLIELGEELVNNLEQNYVPISYKEIARILLSEKILSEKQYKLYYEFISYRNEIAHEYEEVTPPEISWCIKHLNFVDEFLRIVKKFLLK